MDQLCQIIDQIKWKEYLSRTNSGALRKAGSQVGRNIRAVLQIMWYSIWVLIGTDLARYREDLEIFLRVFFYLGKLNYLFYNSHEVTWSGNILIEVNDAIRTIVAIFRRDMEVPVPGSKTHDLEYHLQTDIARHGGPSGFDCQAGESKMKVQKLKNYYSNKQAPGKDVAVKYLKTEIIRHIVSGGSLSADGKVKAADNVLKEAVKYTSLKIMLGIENAQTKIGQASLFDKKQVKPKLFHLLPGVPDKLMRTASKIMTENGPLYRGGGVYVKEQNVVQLGILVEVYKAKVGMCFAIIETLEDVSHQKSDNFLQEAGIKVWMRQGNLRMISNLLELKSAPLLHACRAEVPPTVMCDFETNLIDVREERQDVQQMKTVYRCIGNGGTFFISSAACFSMPVGVGLGCC